MDINKITDKEKEATPHGIKKGGIYAGIKMSKLSADLLVVGCGLIFILAIVLMVVL